MSFLKKKYIFLLVLILFWNINVFSETGQSFHFRIRTNSNSVLNLNGTWDFYWKNFIFPDKIADAKMLSFLYNVPSSWDSKEACKKVFPINGYGTFRAFIDNLTPGKEYGLFIPEVNCAYKLWVNGKYLGGVGKIAKTFEDEIPMVKPCLYKIKPKSKKIEIVIHASNFHDVRGGLTKEIKFSLLKSLSVTYKNIQLIYAFSIGILFIMGIYHIIIFLSRKTEKSNFFFGLFFLLIALRTLIIGPRLIELLFENIHWSTMIKLEHLSMFLGLPAISKFIESLFPEETPKKIINFFVLPISFLFAGVALLTPIHLYARFLTFFMILVLFVSFFLIYIIFKAANKKREFALLLLFGYITLYFTVANDIMLDFHIVNTTYLVPYGMIIFLLSQSVVLSIRFTNSFKQAENLSNLLKEKNVAIQAYSNNLEEIVKARTDELVTQNKQLQEDAAIAQKHQRSLLPQKMPDIENIDLAYLYKPHSKVGGDFLDYYYDDKNSLALFICDVSGHGIASALYASMVKITLNKWSESLARPSGILKEIAYSLNGKLGNKFISAFVCHLDLNSGLLTASNSGHPPAIIIKQNRAIDLLEIKGRVIADFLEPNNVDKRYQLQDGDKIILYTDGITELRNGEGDFFGEKRFYNALKENGNFAPKILCQNIIKTLEDFSGKGNVFDDDIAIIALEYKEKI